MNTIRKKLKSRQGASIILALMFLLVAGVIGSIILFSAYSNAGRLSRMRDEQQAYLAVSSAAKLVRDEIEKQMFTGETTTVSVDGIAYSAADQFTMPDGAFAGFLGAWAKHTYLSVWGAAEPNGLFEIGSELDTVYAEMSMSENYELTVMFYLMDGGSPSAKYRITLIVPAKTMRENNQTTESKEVGTGDDAYIQVTVTNVTKTNVTWGAGLIKKGGI